MIRIEVITKPSFGGWRGQFNTGFRDESLNARKLRRRCAVRSSRSGFSVNFQGPLAKGKTSLSVRADGNVSHDSRTIVATTPTGALSTQHQASVRLMNVNVRVDHALTPTSQLQPIFPPQRVAENLGVGDFDLLDRAYRDGQHHRYLPSAQYARDRREGVQRAGGAVLQHRRDAVLVILGPDRARARLVHQAAARA